VLDLAAEKSGWGQPLPKGSGRGVSVQNVFGSYMAQVAEVAVSKDGDVAVKRITCAVDFGIGINPNTIEAQAQSAIAKAHGTIDKMQAAIVTLRGEVLPIGGVKEKVLAARAAKINTVILPKLNERDLVDVPEPIKRDMTFFFVEHVEDVLKIALLDSSAAGEKTTERQGRESKPLASPEPATENPIPVGQPG